MTYEYVCTSCQHAWEEEQRISAAPLTTCPACHLETAKRQVSGGAGFILKGSGWYADLYSSAKPGKKEDGSGEAKKAADSSGGESKKESSGESKKPTETASSGAAPASTSSSDSGAGTTPSKAAATAT
jgi:putative FmdB family regulatory protein